MKRIRTSILALCLVLLMLTPLCGSAFAEGLGLTSVPLTAEHSLSGNPLVVDEAGLLSEAARESLEQKARDISLAHGCEVIILTVSSTDGKTWQEYAEDYYVDQGYGFGADRNGILLQIDMDEENRGWYIATVGTAIEAFHDEQTDYLVSRFLPDLKNGDYEEAFDIYLDYAEKFLGVYDGSLSQNDVDDINQEYDDYMNGNETPSKPNYVKKILISLGLGAAVGFVPVGVQKSALKTVRKRRDARGYAKEGSMTLNINRDIYLYSNVTSRVIQENRGSGGGHTISSGSSSTHTHSSGTTFGGHGGSF